MTNNNSTQADALRFTPDGETIFTAKMVTRGNAPLFDREETERIIAWTVAQNDGDNENERFEWDGHVLTVTHETWEPGDYQIVRMTDPFGQWLYLIGENWDWMPVVSL